MTEHLQGRMRSDRQLPETRSGILYMGSNAGQERDIGSTFSNRGEGPSNTMSSPGAPSDLILRGLRGPSQGENRMLPLCRCRVSIPTHFRPCRAVRICFVPAETTGRPRRELPTSQSIAEHRVAAIGRVVTPGVWPADLTTSPLFIFRFCRQSPPCPVAVSHGVIPADTVHGMIDSVASTPVALATDRGRFTIAIFHAGRVGCDRHFRLVQEVSRQQNAALWPLVFLARVGPHNKPRPRYVSNVFRMFRCGLERRSTFSHRSLYRRTFAPTSDHEKADGHRTQQVGLYPTQIGWLA